MQHTSTGDLRISCQLLIQNSILVDRGHLEATAEPDLIKSKENEVLKEMVLHLMKEHDAHIKAWEDYTQNKCTIDDFKEYDRLKGNHPTTKLLKQLKR